MRQSLIKLRRTVHIHHPQYFCFWVFTTLKTEQNDRKTAPNQV
jgi:hypothetical protein